MEVSKYADNSKVEQRVDIGSHGLYSVAPKRSALYPMECKLTLF